MLLPVALLLCLWLLLGLVLVALCRCAARGDAVAHDVLEHHRAVHWSRLER